MGPATERGVAVRHDWFAIAAVTMVDTFAITLLPSAAVWAPAELDLSVEVNAAPSAQQPVVVMPPAGKRVDLDALLFPTTA